jgi:hypothetical protein
MQVEQEQSHPAATVDSNGNNAAAASNLMSKPESTMEVTATTTTNTTDNMDLSNASDEVDQLAPSPASHHLESHSSSTPDANAIANANAASSSHQQHSNEDGSDGHQAQQGQQGGNDSLLSQHIEDDAGEHHEPGDDSHDHDEPMQNPNHTAGITYNGHPLSGDPLMIIDKSKIPRPYKCPFPNCDKAFYRLEQ